MKLKRLFVFRHGPYEGRGFLTPEGRVMIEKQAESIRQRYALDPAATIVICSRELRTFKTAQCMMVVLDIDELKVVCHQALFSDDRSCDVAGALELVKKYADDCENLIVVTHEEMATFLPVCFCTKILSIPEEDIPSSIPSYGQGFFIDCGKRTCEFIG